MVKISVFIDTQLWVFALKIPETSNFNSKTEYEIAIQRYKLASAFLKLKLSTAEILMTNFQLSELFHALGFRGAKLPLHYVQEYCTELLRGEYMHWYNVKNEDVKRAIELSTQSKIHIWDYLCVLPLYKDADVLYSCDEHFENDTFKSLGVLIDNPINEWTII